jgi:hypothetical protein
MKILLAELVRRCDITMEAGLARHKNFEFETNVSSAIAKFTYTTNINQSYTGHA